jgi:hypothetical protein
LLFEQQQSLRLVTIRATCSNGDPDTTGLTGVSTGTIILLLSISGSTQTQTRKLSCSQTALQIAKLLNRAMKILPNAANTSQRNVESSLAVKPLFAMSGLLSELAAIAAQ